MMLEVKSLTKHFGGLAAVNGIDLKIEKGQILGLIGPNGAGKTTVFNLITGFITPTRGKVFFENKEITREPPHLRAKSGLVRTFQSDVLFPSFTTLQNVIAACHLSPSIKFWESFLHFPECRKKDKVAFQRSLDILEFMGLLSFREVLPSNLAHGYRRKLGIAVAMAAKPKLLLLDEPLSGMTTEEITSALQLIKEIRLKGTTIFMIEHNMRAVMDLCDEIVVLNFGKKIAEGTCQEIKNNQEVIKAYLGASANAV
jgi:branched-chain amino acid transport system ATP-binding protein